MGEQIDTPVNLTATFRLPNISLEIPLGEIDASVDIPPDEVENLTG